MHCNHPLTDYITSLIGDEFKTNATALENLLKYKDDEAVLNKLLEIKTEAKKTCKEFILSNTGVEINENSIYDIQIKRLHEYKRQQLNALYIISKYLEIKGGKKPSQPVTFIFGAKAAPAYVIAKDIIHLLLTLQDLIKDDSEVAPYMKLVMVENYNVSAAEKLFPAHRNRYSGSHPSKPRPRHLSCQKTSGPSQSQSQTSHSPSLLFPAPLSMNILYHYTSKYANS